MRTKNEIRLARIGAVCAALMLCGQAHASLTRNPAGSKNMGEKGTLIIDTAAQFEADPDGTAEVLELGVQYQFTDRLQGLIEAAPLVSFRPNGSERVTDTGDTEVTLSWLAYPGGEGNVPSVVLGGRVKIPTAVDEELGSQKTDFGALAVFGVEKGELELSLETEYVKFGQIGGERLKDQFLYTLIAEFAFNNLVAAYGEVFGNTAPTALESGSNAARLGLELDFSRTEKVTPYLSFEIDTNETASVRGGFEWKW